MKEFNKKHQNTCGAGTLVILNINSTYVMILRGKRCAPWASLYLDEHGEEDRDLKFLNFFKIFYKNKLSLKLMNESVLLEI